MKALLINGSPRKDGNTFTALSQVAAQLEKNGIETELVWIGNKPVRGCIACSACKQNGNGRCVFTDDICAEISDKLEAADALVVGSPVYYGTPAGNLLNLIHRMFHAGVKVDGKPAAAVTICRRGGSSAAFQCLQMPFQMMNMPIVTSQYWNIAFGREEGQAALDREGMQTMRTLADNMAWLLKKIHTGEGDIPEREAWDAMHFIR